MAADLSGRTGPEEACRENRHVAALVEIDHSAADVDAVVGHLDTDVEVTHRRPDQVGGKVQRRKSRSVPVVANVWAAEPKTNGGAPGSGFRTVPGITPPTNRVLAPGYSTFE